MAASDVTSDLWLCFLLRAGKQLSSRHMLVWSRICTEALKGKCLNPGENRLNEPVCRGFCFNWSSECPVLASLWKSKRLAAFWQKNHYGYLFGYLFLGSSRRNWTPRKQRECRMSRAARSKGKCFILSSLWHLLSLLHSLSLPSLLPLSLSLIIC